MRKEIDFAGQAAVGSRSTQEDYAEFSTSQSKTELLAVLADGMGGHSGGEIASKTAVDAFHGSFNTYPSNSTPTRLGAALNQANTDLASAVKGSPALAGMGCTLVGMHIGVQGLQWISVGDSPLFLYRKGKLRRLNADHSMTPVIEESVRQGKITKEEAIRHPDRHALRSALTGDPLAMVDTSGEPFSLKKGDVIVLASDGLLTLTPEEITQVIKKQTGATAPAVASALIKAVTAKSKPRQDNTTVQVVIAPASLGAPYSTVSTLLWRSAASLAAVVLFSAASIYFWKDGSLTWPKVPAIFERPEASPAPEVIPTPVVPVDMPPAAASAAPASTATPPPAVAASAAASAAAAPVPQATEKSRPPQGAAPTVKSPPDRKITTEKLRKVD